MRLGSHHGHVEAKWRLNKDNSLEVSKLRSVKLIACTCRQVNNKKSDTAGVPHVAHRINCRDIVWAAFWQFKTVQWKQLCLTAMVHCVKFIKDWLQREAFNTVRRMIVREERKPLPKWKWNTAGGEETATKKDRGKTDKWPGHQHLQEHTEWPQTDAKSTRTAKA